MRRGDESSWVLTLSLVVGVCAGLAAVALEKAIDLIQKWVLPWILGGGHRWMLVFLPAVGMLLAYLNETQKQDLSLLPEDIRKSDYPAEVDGTAPLANRDPHTVYIGEIVNAYILKNT